MVPRQYATKAHSIGVGMLLLLLFTAIAVSAVSCGQQAKPTATPVHQPNIPEAARVIWGWGDNAQGQLGVKTSAACQPVHALPCSVRPIAATLPLTGKGLKALAGGASHSLLLTTDGSVFAWGENGAGQLGDGTMVNQTAGVWVRLPTGVRITAIAAGDSHNLALTADGQIYAWGDNGWGELGTSAGQICSGMVTCVPSPVLVKLPAGMRATAIAAGGAHSLALMADGSVYAWGNNTVGQTGNGTVSTAVATPTRVQLPGGSSAVAIADGGNTAMALLRDGAVYSWGGQLQDGTSTVSSTPVRVGFPAGVTVTAIAAGSDHNLALDAAGRLYSWGMNRWGELGNGTVSASATATPAPVLMPADVKVSAIAAGSAHSLALTTTGELYAWGYNYYGQLGIGSTAHSRTPVRVAFPAGAHIVVFATGDWDSLALTGS